MFDSHYTFRHISTNAPDDKFGKEVYAKLHLYTFDCRKNHQYIVHVEEYDCNLYALKFYLKNHRLSDDKYNILTNHQDLPRIVVTCIKIFFSIRDLTNPMASLAFIGARLPTEESNKSTKRFRLYSFIVSSFFAPVDFEHFDFADQSLYLLLSKKNDIPAQLLRIEELMGELSL
jgi:hypothetical protein